MSADQPRQHGNGKLAGKNAIVTGGGSGIGRAIARRFAAEGARVALLDVNLAGARETRALIEKAGGTALALECDVSEWPQVKPVVKDVVDAFGQLDVLVNNAGISDYKRLGSMTPAFWDRMMAVNARSVFLVTKAVVRYMRRNKPPAGQLRGKIINTSSIAGKEGQLEMSAYAASKAAVSAFTIAMARELGPRKIAVNAVCPGTIHTPIYGNMTEEQLDGIDGVPALHAYKKVGKPEDVASVVCFLASADSNYITGQNINVDAGLCFH